MKIFIILDQFSESDAANLILNEEREFRRREIGIFIITLKREDEKNTIAKRLVYPEGDMLCMPVSSVFDLLGFYKLFKFIKNEQPDFVMTHLPFGNVVGRLAAFLAGVPKIFTFEEPGRPSFLSRRLQYITDRIIANTYEAKDLLVDNGIKPEKIFFLEDSIDLKSYDRTDIADLRKEFGIEPDKFLFLFIGPLVQEQAVDVLLRAIDKIPEAVLLVMGDGEERKSLEDLSTKLLLRGRVFFFPVIKKISKTLMMADCLVMPKRSGGDNKILVEAFAAGTPIIVSDFPGYEKYVQDKVSGLVVRRQDSEELALAMKRFMTDSELVQNIRKNSSSKLLNYSPEAHAEKILELVAETGGVFRNFLNAIRFLAVSCASFVLQLFTTYLLVHFSSFPIMYSVGIGFIVGAISAFLPQKLWAFRDSDLVKFIWQIPIYMVVSVVNLLFCLGALYVSEEILHTNYVFAQSIAGTLIVFETYYIYKKLFAS